MKKHINWKRVCALGLASAMMFTALKIDAKATGLTGNTDDFAGVVGGHIPTEEDFNVPSITRNRSEEQALNKLATSYNSYEEGKLPAVRNQGSEGCCWAFANVGAVEADLIHDGTLSASNTDFSELQLAYFTSHQFNDEKNCHNGDLVQYNGTESYMSNGGNSTQAYRYMTNMVGVVSEADVPYSAGPSYVPNDAYAIHSNAAQVKAAYNIDIDDRASIKEAIQNHGGVAAAFWAYSSMSNDAYDATYNSFYNAEDASTNHEVMLVGWNDNFPKSHFKTTPAGDGAWLVRNSWGLDGYGYQGYFWMSYYDVGLLASGKVVAYDADTNCYDHIYSYDYSPLLGMSTTVGSGSTAQQRFTVNGGETIKAVGIELGSTNASVTASVTVGANTETGTVNTTYAGYYTIPLDHAISVGENSEAVVTLTFTTSDNSDVTIRMEGVGNQTFGGIHYTAAHEGVSGKVNETVKNYDLRLRLFTDNTSGTTPATGVSFLNSSLSLGVGETYLQPARVLPSTATNKNVTLTSSNPGVATVTNAGLITAVSPGTTTITALTEDGGFTATCTVTVSRTDLSGLALESIPSQTYSGDALTPNVTIKKGNVTLTNGTDYTLSYSNNKNVGTATVTATGKGSYTGTLTGTFRINKRAINTTNITVRSKTFDDTSEYPELVIKYGNKTLTEDDDYWCYVSDGSLYQVGPITLTIYGAGNFDGTTTVQTSITARPLSSANLTVYDWETGNESGISDRAYTGEQIKPTPIIYANMSGSNRYLVEGTDYTVSYGENVNVGTGTITLTGKGNYTGTKTFTFRITEEPSIDYPFPDVPVPVPDTPEEESLEMYRLYNPYSGEHLYTNDVVERDTLSSIGWNYEGVAWNAPSYGIAVYRLYNPNSGEHHYTKDMNEITALVTIGWNNEGIKFYTFEDGVPMYRLFNPNAEPSGMAPAAHHYTKELNERDTLIGLGYQDEGISWYGR